MDDPQLFKEIGREKKLKDFHLLKVIGIGSFAKVFMCKEIGTGEILAMKVMKKQVIIEDDDCECVLAENNVLQKIKHPFLMSLKYSFQSRQRIYFVTEYYPGGDLMFQIQRARKFDEVRARFYGAELTLALGYLHELKIVYRDIKLDNVLLDRDGHVKLIDFGMCKEGIGDGHTTSTFCGTPDFIAPEILEEKDYGHSVDWWAMGILMYEMMCGQPPFEEDNEDKLFEAILHDVVLYPTWLSSEANSLLVGLLTKNPSRRLGCGENDYKDIMKHLFFKPINFDDLFAKKITPPFLPRVQSEADFSNFDSDFTSEKPMITPPESDNEDSPGDKSAADATHHLPSGHILTKQELQVLGTLLAPYTDENLKELQVLIQKEQEGDISREEVEVLLRQSGLMMIADGLKDDIAKGVENIKHYEAYEQALKDGISLTLRYLKFLFLGPPRSGKTSARRRLVQEIINLSRLGQPSKSTGVAETNDVIIKKLVCESTAIVDSMWQTLQRSQSQGEGDGGAQQHEGDLTYLAQWFYRLISTTTSDGAMTTKQDATQVASITESDTPSESDSSSDPGLLKRRNHTAVRVKPQKKMRRLNESEELEIQGALDKLTTILQSDSPLELQQLLKELTMINMVDVGGQPALLEMLPSLTIGPALYFLFFRLDQELGKSYQVRYHPIDKETETTLESSYCIEDILYQSLSSIACFGCQSQKDMSSGVLLFATYKDKVDDSRISQIAGSLEEKLLKTKLYQEGLLLKTSKGELFFSLDNMNGDESEMSEIRSDVEEIVKKHFSATPIPAAWLMFRIVLHLLHKPVLSLAQCRAIARKLSMPTSVEEALWFFHHNIGNLMYYSDIPSMQDTVICDPQVIFDSVSELIIDRFRHSNRSLSSHEVDDFHHKGQFSLAQIDDKTEQQRSGHLKLVQMVDLLKDLNIIAEIKEDEDEDEVDASATDQSQLPAAAYQSRPPATDQSQPKFIMPAVLKYASEEELKMPVVTNPDNQCVPIIIHFESGFVPFGVFCATIAHIIARQDSLSRKWRMCDDQVMRNKATFSIDGAFFATVVSRDQYLEIHVSRHPRARKRKSLSSICSTVRQTVVDSLQVVLSKMKFKPYVKMDTFFSSRQPFALAFTCCLEKSHSKHLMKVVVDSPSERYAQCLTNGVEIDLEDEHMVWFKEELEKQSKSESHSVKAPVTPSQANESNTVLEKPAQVVAATIQAADVKCPVCLNIQVDPCTLSCGHSVCQLCLARLWKNNEKFCPVCKQTWREFPAISYDYRTSIEGSYSHEVDHIRKHYNEEDKQCIENFLKAREFSLISERIAQKTLLMDTKKVEGEDIRDLNNEQLAVWLSNHPRLMETDYQHDIQKLKEVNMDGYAFLSMDKGSLEQFGLSAQFRTPLMIIIEEMKKHQQSLESKTYLQPYQRKSSDSTAAAAMSTTEGHQQSQSTTGQQTQLEHRQQPQALSANQPSVDVQPQPLAFSTDMNYEQLAVWLTNHPLFAGVDYQQDISKIKGARINGYVLLNLDESTLRQFGVSFGFHFTLMNIIGNLKRGQEDPDGKEKLLPSQQQQQFQAPSGSAATPHTIQRPPTSSATDKQTKFEELPTLDELLILKYMDKGKKKKLRIISEASHKWKDIANLICGDANITSVLEQKCHSDPNECLKQTFISYFISKKPQRYTQDWNGLIELLDDVDLETLAENVKQALPCAST